MPRAIIAGGSLAGLFAGNLLCRAGWDVTINERVAEPLAGRGAGIVTHPPLFDALREAGVPGDASVGVPVAGRVTYGADGRVVGRRDMGQTFTSWSRLHALLSDALPQGVLRRGRAVTGAVQDAAGVSVAFSDGATEAADLLVGADGLRSVVRALHWPEVAPAYAGYIAWRAVVAEAALSPAARAALMPYLAFCLPEGEQMLGYPVAGEDDSVAPGHRRFNIVWYRPADDAALAAMQTDATGRHFANGIPPGQIRPELVAAARADAARLLAPCFAEVVARAAPLFFQPIQDLTVPGMAFGRIAILGDAAFVVRPHPGMGVTKAACDAVALARALAGSDVPAALRRFDAERQPVGAGLVAHARRLGAYMQAQQRSPEERAAAAQFRSVEAVMRDTAVLVEGLAA